MRIKTLFVKVFGVATSVIGGLAGGKEGPMIHSGAIVAAGLSQGKSTTFKIDFGFFRAFRNDHEKRDFVVGGAAAGVSAAFGSPIGGLLFSLEEGASFWNQTLIWRTMVASIISSFTLNFVLSTYHKNGSLQFPGLFNLGEFEPLHFEYFELIIFMLMGVAGGLLGSLWNFLNIRINVFRMKYVKQRSAKVLECVLVAMLSATLGSLMMYAIADCKPLGNDPVKFPVTLNCEDTEYNAVAALWFQTPEASVKSLFHDPPGSHKIITVLVFVVIYYFLSCFTFGLNVSMGIFIPLLLVGAAWGRLVAMTLGAIVPVGTAAFAHPGKYALIGAAAQLGGVVRMTISLSVILIESTGNISFALPLIVTLISAKWMGDYFNDGIYDTQINIWRVPFLPWDLKPFYQRLNARHIMSSPVVCIRVKERATKIYAILKRYPHNGFPVVEQHANSNYKYGRSVGFMLRHQLITILRKRLFEENKPQWLPTINMDTFLSEYPRYPSIEVGRSEMIPRGIFIKTKCFLAESRLPRATHDDQLPNVFESQPAHCGTGEGIDFIDKLIILTYFPLLRQLLCRRFSNFSALWACGILL